MLVLIILYIGNHHRVQGHDIISNCLARRIIIYEERSLRVGAEKNRQLARPSKKIACDDVMMMVLADIAFKANKNHLPLLVWCG